MRILFVSHAPFAHIKWHDQEDIKHCLFCWMLYLGDEQNEIVSGLQSRQWSSNSGSHACLCAGAQFRRWKRPNDIGIAIQPHSSSSSIRREIIPNGPYWTFYLYLFGPHPFSSVIWRWMSYRMLRMMNESIYIFMLSSFWRF